MESYWPSIVGVLAVLIAVGFFIKRTKPFSPGSTVKESLENLGKDYSVFSDILVTLKGGMYCISHLVVSRWGVFMIDERHEKGAVRGKLDQKEWFVTGPGSKETLYNPVWRAREAINKLNDKGEDIQITSLIVFVNARLKTDLGKDVVSLRDLPGRIKQESKVILDEARIKMILSKLGNK